MKNIIVCPKCRGEGCVIVEVEVERNHGRMGTGYDYAQCPTCEGTGLVKEIITYESHEPMRAK